MARDEAPPFARGETYYNGDPIYLTDPLGLGGENLLGKEFVFEPNSQDQMSGGYSNSSTDPNGRPIRVKVVRNTSAVNLLPARLAHFDETGVADPVAGATTGVAGARKLETGVDGYCYQLADSPAGVVDEFLPAAGVVPWDLFYIVIDGPTVFTNQSAAPITTTIGANLVPATTGSTRGDNLAGRVALQDLTGASTVLGENLQNRVGKAEVVNTSSNATFAGVIHRHSK